MSEVYLRLIQAYQTTTQKHLQWLIQSKDSLELIPEIEGTRCTFERWLCLIQLSHQSARFTLKLHFGEKFGSFLQKQPLDFKDLPTVFDQARELCNLTMGTIKQRFGDIPVGVSLPLMTGGFDEIYLRPPSDKLSFSRIWSFKHPDFQVYFSLEALILNLETLEKLSFSEDEMGTSTDSELELF